MKHVFSIGALILSLALLVSSCASYRAVALSNLSPVIVQGQEHTKNGGILVAAKAFNKTDCKKYLDRDVLAVGYQPVQLYIQNNSDKTYIFTTERVSLTCATAEEVADKVHTSTVGRAVGYGAAAAIVFLPLAIPAVVDGVKSSQANAALDADFDAKVAHDRMIFPHSHFNKIIFVPAGEYQSSFLITLVDAESNEAMKIEVMAA